MTSGPYDQPQSRGWSRRAPGHRAEVLGPQVRRRSHRLAFRSGHGHVVPSPTSRKSSARSECRSQLQAADREKPWMKRIGPPAVTVSTTWSRTPLPPVTCACVSMPPQCQQGARAPTRGATRSSRSPPRTRAAAIFGQTPVAGLSRTCRSVSAKCCAARGCGPGLSQEALAERAALSARGISDLERATRRRPFPATVRRLAEALGLSEADRQVLQAAARRRGRRRPARRPSRPWHPQELRGGLPVAHTSFVGRDTQLAELGRELGVSRLLTLVRARWSWQDSARTCGGGGSRGCVPQWRRLRGPRFVD